MRVFELYLLFDHFWKDIGFCRKDVGRGGKERPDFGLLNS